MAETILPRPGSWCGTLLHVCTAPAASQPMEEHAEARLTAGVGIDGDRYATGMGTYSKRPQPERQVTLIEIETLEALARDHGIAMTPQESRRNLTTRGVPLNHLVGRRFRVGATVVLEGRRLNVPCQYLEDLLGRPVFKSLLNRSGLNCVILEGGLVRPGDLVRPLEG
jgi:MOSC domain-containing protein YiiM